jgi:hypothetical protein
MKNWVFVIVISLNLIQAYGQVVNIENRRIYDDTIGWSGAFDATFSAVQNKDLLMTASFRPRIQYKTRNHYYLFLTDWVYSKGADKIYANSGMIHFRYAYRLGDHKDTTKKSPWKWESYTQIQYNQLLDQRMRALLGSGLRLKMLDKKGDRLFAGVSTFYEYEEILSSELINRNLRSSNYISWFLSFTPTFSSTGVVYYQPLWSDFNDFRIMSQLSMNFNVFKRIDLRLEFNTFYDSNPPVNVNEWVFNTSFGIRVKLGE